MMTSQIKLIRLETNDICTTGVILINGRMVALSLEPPKFGNVVEFSCIPCETYNYIKRVSAHHKYEIIELTNVYNRSYIQIHVGNRPDQTSGCILPGLSLSTWSQFDGKTPSVYSPIIFDSRDALNLILSLTTPTGIVTITEHF